MEEIACVFEESVRIRIRIMNVTKGNKKLSRKERIYPNQTKINLQVDRKNAIVFPLEKMSFSSASLRSGDIPKHTDYSTLFMTYLTIFGGMLTSQVLEFDVEGLELVVVLESRLIGLVTRVPALADRLRLRG